LNQSASKYSAFITKQKTKPDWLKMSFTFSKKAIVLGGRRSSFVELINTTRLFSVNLRQAPSVELRCIGSSVSNLFQRHLRSDELSLLILDIRMTLLVTHRNLLVAHGAVGNVVLVCARFKHWRGV
jgi:hypothetical protein